MTFRLAPSRPPLASIAGTKWEICSVGSTVSWTISRCFSPIESSLRTVIWSAASAKLLPHTCSNLICYPVHQPVTTQSPPMAGRSRSNSHRAREVSLSALCRTTFSSFDSRENDTSRSSTTGKDALPGHGQGTCRKMVSPKFRLSNSEPLTIVSPMKIAFLS